MAWRDAAMSRFGWCYAGLSRANAIEEIARMILGAIDFLWATIEIEARETWIGRFQLAALNVYPTFVADELRPNRMAARY